MLTLSRSNTFTGNTFVAAGTLDLAYSLALENSTLDTGGSGSISFDSLTAATIGGLEGPGILRLSNTSAPIVLSIGSNGEITTFSGNLVGPGSLNKIGSGTLTLSGTNTYTGATTVLAGTLIVTNRWAIEDGTSLNVGSIFAPEAVVPGDAGFDRRGLFRATRRPRQEMIRFSTVVPEPPTLTLLGVGAIGLLASARQWRNAIGLKAKPFFQRRA